MNCRVPPGRPYFASSSRRNPARAADGSQSRYTGAWSNAAGRRPSVEGLRLDKAGIHNVFEEVQGTAHDWQTWRWAFYGFAPRLFQK